MRDNVCPTSLAHFFAPFFLIVILLLVVFLWLKAATVDTFKAESLIAKSADHK